MRSILRLSFDGESTARRRDVGQLLTELCERRHAAPETIWQVEAPPWLDAQFAPEQTQEEGAEWIAEFRRSTLERRDAMTLERGWGRAAWLHWFSNQNVFWRIRKVGADPSSPDIIVHIEHDDDLFPISALLWFASAAGASMGDRERDFDND